jgi:hypothetical protein
MRNAIVGLIMLVLVGCVPLTTPPPYVVLVTADDPRARCTGVLLDSLHVLTAAHCAAFVTSATSTLNQVVRVRYALTDNSVDLAVLVLQEQLYATAYASVANVDVLAPAILYGQCPRFWPHIGRSAMYVAVDVLGNHIWRADGCSGDSGAPLVQNGKVVGVLLRVYKRDPTSFPWQFAEGQVVYSINPQVFLERVLYP